MQSGIRQKLNEFIHTYYRQRLIRGAMTAGALGLVVFGSGFLLEHYLWLGSVDRAVLFWAMWLLFLPLVAFGVMKPLLPSVGAAAGYYINVGLFADEANARKAQARLLNEGLPAFRQELNNAKGRRIRVRVGPYESRAKAEAAAASIRAMALEAVVFKQ